MSEKPPVLRLEHVGEAVVAALIREAKDKLPTAGVLDVRTGGERTLADLGVGVPRDARSCVLVDRSPVPRGLDGMHGIDVALVYEDDVAAIELKLGTTALSPSAFVRRFLRAPAETTHSTGRWKASVPAMLEHNGTPDFVLRADLGSDRELDVRRDWLLVLADDVYRSWSKQKVSAERLRTRNLAGVLRIGELVRVVGGEDVATEIVKSLLAPSIDRMLRGQP